MATNDQVRWYGDELERFIHAEMTKRMHLATAKLKNRVRQRLNLGKSRLQGPSHPGTAPHANLGTLRDSIFARVDGSHRYTVTGDVGTALRYGLAHELGCHIRPVRARALAIPISPEAKRRGGSPRDFPRELVMIKRQGKSPLLVESKNRMSVIHYVLVPSVTLPPRPFLRPTLREWWHEIVRILNRPIRWRVGGRR